MTSSSDWTRTPRLMNAPSHGDVTRLLAAMRDGDASALQELTPIVYQELRGLARALLRRSPTGQTLRTTALVHDVYLKLLGHREDGWEGRSHFLAVAAKAVRQVLANHVRARQAGKRGGGWERVTLSGIGAQEREDVDLVHLDAALTKLAGLDERQCELVEMRHLAGMSVEETAEALGVSTRTVEREWRAARAWLSAELQKMRA